MQRLSLYSCLILAIGCGGTATRPAPAVSPPEAERPQEVIELPKEVGLAIMKEVLKNLPAAAEKFWKELYTEFEIKDDVEKRVFHLPVGDCQTEDFLTVFCVVKPGPKPLPVQVYRKQLESGEVRYARVTAPASKPLALILVRKNDGTVRLCEAAIYEEKVGKWVPRADVLKGEKESVRRAVAEVLKGIDPKMPGLAGLP
jgi:hypothetical protein